MDFFLPLSTSLTSGSATLSRSLGLSLSRRALLGLGLAGLGFSLSSFPRRRWNEAISVVVVVGRDHRLILIRDPVWAEEIQKQIVLIPVKSWSLTGFKTLQPGQQVFFMGFVKVAGPQGLLHVVLQATRNTHVREGEKTKKVREVTL